jgi:hypothetical protein
MARFVKAAWLALVLLMTVSLAAQDAPVISEPLLADVLEIETLVSGTRGPIRLVKSPPFSVV